MVSTMFMFIGFLLIGTISIGQGYRGYSEDENEMVFDQRNLRSKALRSELLDDSALLDMFSEFNVNRRQDVKKRCQTSLADAQFKPTGKTQCSKSGDNLIVQSWQECLNACNNAPDCITWSYVTKCGANICYLMTQKGERREGKDIISGVCDATQKVSDYWGCGNYRNCWRGAGGNGDANLYGPDWCPTSGNNVCNQHSDCTWNAKCTGKTYTDASLVYDCVKGRCARSCYLRTDKTGASNMNGWCYTQVENPIIKCTKKQDCLSAVQKDQCVEPCRDAKLDPMSKYL